MIICKHIGVITLKKSNEKRAKESFTKEWPEELPVPKEDRRSYAQVTSLDIPYYIYNETENAKYVSYLDLSVQVWG